MQIRDKIREELAMGIPLLAFQSIKADLAPMSLVDEAMHSAGWDAVSEASGDGRTSDYSKFYYNTALKTYAHALCGGYTGACTVEAVEEGDVLEQLTFPELKKLSGLIDKKSVAFIRIYSEKELASASSQEELNALNARNDRIIAEAEVALRKR
ncbi:MAG: hypothetical protein IJT94_16235 [Oscillibacter sp.]|nr:hypothetical protein [Oscillibacter sp.]